MQKIIAFEDILVVNEQARRAGQVVGKQHRALNVRLVQPSHVEEYGLNEAERAWQKIQRSIPALHHAWTGHKPQFLNTFAAAFLVGYSEENPRGYELFAFPEVVDTPRFASSRKARKQARRMERSQSAPKLIVIHKPDETPIVAEQPAVPEAVPTPTAEAVEATETTEAVETTEVVEPAAETVAEPAAEPAAVEEAPPEQAPVIQAAPVTTVLHTPRSSKKKNRNKQKQAA